MEAAMLSARLVEAEEERDESRYMHAAALAIVTEMSAEKAAERERAERAEAALKRARDLLGAWRGCLSATEAEVFALRNETSAFLADR
jgi:hypothetical protein